MLTQRNEITIFFVIILLAFSLHSFQYWTLNPGQEATEPTKSPRNPMSILRADEYIPDRRDADHEV
jgi:hypothetical protein